jgi:hypothetical protein
MPVHVHKGGPLHALHIAGSRTDARLRFTGVCANRGESGDREDPDCQRTQDQRRRDEARRGGFTALVAADAVSADMGGVMKVSDFVKSMDQAKIQSFQILNPQVMWVDDKSAVVVYTWKGKGTWIE